MQYHLLNGFTSVNELGNKDKFLRIDQDALEKLESIEITSKDDLKKFEREKFNTVGKVGKPGEQIQCVVGVNMLSKVGCKNSN